MRAKYNCYVSCAPTGKGCYAYVPFPLCIFTEMSMDDAAL
jgi:hypothetical protein